MSAATRVPSSLDGGNEGEPSGLSGWLLLVGLGLLLSPLRLGLMMFEIYVPIFADGTWAYLTTPGTDAYHVLWAPLLVFELVGNAAILITTLALLVLFVRKSVRFPPLYVILQFVSLLFIVGDAYFASYVIVDEPMFDPETRQETLRALVGVCIWVPYMMKSERVRNTFVEGAGG